MRLRWWAVPSFSGDLRIESDPSDEKQVVLTIHKPTLGEKKVLDQITAVAIKRGWLASTDAAKRSGFLWRKKKVVLRAPIDVVGPVAAKIMRPGRAVLTALALSGGKVIVTEGTDLSAVASLDDKREEKREEKALEKVEEKPPVAATIKRPTPSCPACQPGAIEPATEVLLSFLTSDEHESWGHSRAIVVEGGTTGHRYVVAHRHSRLAQRFGRICFDLDDRGVMHFHDWSVPPEEEVLATKLILEHREEWLRNEATALFRGASDVLKNPFGGRWDGVESTQFTSAFGGAMLGSLWA